MCTSESSHARKCSKYCNCMYFFHCQHALWQVLSLGQPSVSQTIPWHDFEVCDYPLVKGDPLWRLGGFNDSDSSIFAPVGLNASKHCLALFYLVLQMSPQGPHITVSLLTILSTTVICHSSGMCSSFCLTDLYFSVNCSVSSTVSVLVHGQIANSREKTLSSISKHFISWLKISHRREVSSLYASKCIYS